MSSKVLLLVVTLIGSEYVLLSAAEENAESLEEKKCQDAVIHTMLFGETPNLRECLDMKDNPAAIKQKNSKKIKPFWNVFILKEEKKTNKTLYIQQCSGSLIHPKVVLTAAHCIFRKPIGKLRVRAGEYHKRTEFHQERHIKTIVSHRKYDPISPKNDIALLIVNEAFNINDHVKTICLMSQRNTLDISYVRCFATGSHRKNRKLIKHANFKNLSLPIIPNTNCENALRLTGLGEDFILDGSFICAGGEVNTTRLLDGGAPLVCPICSAPTRFIQVGVMSWGFKDAPFPDAFTAIKTAYRWIERQFRKMDLKLPRCKQYTKLV